MYVFNYFGRFLADSFDFFFYLFLLQCLHEKTEVYKKLSSFTSEAASPSDNNVLFKTLQEELKRCVSLTKCYASFHIVFLNNIDTW